MKRIFIFIMAAMLVLLLSNSCLFFFGDEDGYIRIVNNNDTYDIYEVWIDPAPVFDLEFDTEYLGYDIISTYESKTFAVSPDTYDVMIVDDVDDWADEIDVIVTPGDTVTLVYNGVTLTEQ